MVVDPRDSTSSETVLRSIDELQLGGTVYDDILYRQWCVYTLFQGEPAKSCPCSNLLFLSMLTLRSSLWGSIVMTTALNALNVGHRFMIFKKYKLKR